MDTNNLQIYYDALQEAHWFKGLDERLENTELCNLSSGDNPESIKRLLEYDRPDIILGKGENPLLVIEKTREVPTGHNIGQRFARLVRAVEENVPLIYYLPFLANKHGAYEGRCFINARLLEALFKLKEIHGVEALAINWPCDDDHELIMDESKDDMISDVLSEFLDNDFTMKNNPSTERCEERMKEEYRERVEMHPSYKRPPGSVDIVKTEEYLKKTDVAEYETAPEKVKGRDESVIYTMRMSPQNCRREDPYAGTQFVYDYLWCRDGPDPDDKYRNLFLNFPKIGIDRWIEANPNEETRKSSLWYAVATGMIFNDELMFDFDRAR